MFEKIFGKRIVILAILFLFTGSELWAQLRTMPPRSSRARGIELFGFYGYQFGGAVPTNLGDINIIDTGNYGLALDFEVRRGVALELLYNRQDTQLELSERTTGIKRNLFDMDVNYFQIGVVRMQRRGKVAPFGTFTIGAAYFHPKSAQYEDEWRFSVTGGVGVKVDTSDKLGFRLQFNLLMPIQWSGASLWCGTGGCDIGVGGGTSLIQGNITGGLYYRL
jgi:hypothetical protein